MFIGFDERELLPSRTLNSEFARSHVGYGFIHLSVLEIIPAHTHKSGTIISAALKTGK